ncbi:hypothetical protein AOQ84DRAFT_52563 [Glonium stellatum]|uniref:Uncharacterized protein n=1 Tax=Glonium stellatum TaxID=574774 RepID=A0A8E2F021_9PEZI|nr:hypothetical protein AOQ84DRAFT_52563 [Glonium stellatum]
MKGLPPSSPLLGHSSKHTKRAYPCRPSNLRDEASSSQWAYLNSRRRKTASLPLLHFPGVVRLCPEPTQQPTNSLPSSLPGNPPRAYPRPCPQPARSLRTLGSRGRAAAGNSVLRGIARQYTLAVNVFVLRNLQRLSSASPRMLVSPLVVPEPAEGRLPAFPRSCVMLASACCIMPSPRIKPLLARLGFLS